MADDCIDIEKLYEYGEKLNEAKDKSQFHIGEKLEASIVSFHIGAICQCAPKQASQNKTKCFSNYAKEYCYVRVQAICGLPLFCKDNPEHLAKIVDIIGQLLVAGDNVEHDAVHKALISLLRQDVKTSLTSLFRHIGSTEDRSADDISTWETIREKVLCFIKDKVFPLKGEILKPLDKMERHLTNLIKLNLQDVTAVEFKMFIDVLKSLSLFGQKALVERVEELVEIIEGQADLDVSDGDHIDRFISCLCIALPFFMRGASSIKFLNYLNKQIIPVFDKLAEEECLCKTTGCKTDSSINCSTVKGIYFEGDVNCADFQVACILSITANATNSLCGYKIVTGQPSDRLGEDFSDLNKAFTERLSTIEVLAKAMNKKLTQGMV
ncbi:unnamed protein product [Fraxinus pennsylvanica]|uniref:Uncharacterized protein n=1 Tax=Fraxinus pennsylvanica TaxID=56036 RepID=A0AAD2ADJ9_9LAMI|nr:unnamed protein product [Fraxinus pennsylvanica]